MATKPNLNPSPIGNFIAHSLFWFKLGLVPIFYFRVSTRSHICYPSLLEARPHPLPQTLKEKTDGRERLRKLR